LRQSLAQHLPSPKDLEVPLSWLEQPPYLLELLLYVNVGAETQRRLSADGKILVSDRCDPLCFGSMRTCHLRALELLAHTSWGELVARRHDGPEGLLDALCFVLDLWSRTPKDEPRPRTRFEGFGSADGNLLAQRVQQLFSDCQAFFSTTPRGRYVIGLGDRYFLLERSDRGFGWIRQDTIGELLDSLAQPRDHYSPPACDPQVLGETPFPAVFGACRPGELQLFYHGGRDEVTLYTLDESGSLFVQTSNDRDVGRLLQQQGRFLECLTRLRPLSGVVSTTTPAATGPFYFRLEHASGRGWHAEPVATPNLGAADDFLELRFVAQNTASGMRVLSLSCGEQGLNALSLGDRFHHEAARLVLGHRRGGGYPIYLTQVELIPDRYGVAPSGVALMALKRHIEQRLNLELSELAKDETH
jgi:adenylate cyclase class 1